jgi:hypothetical protein
MYSCQLTILLRVTRPVAAATCCSQHKLDYVQRVTAVRLGVYMLSIVVLTSYTATTLDTHTDVQQSTGEDWTDVALTLSTAKPTAATTDTAAAAGAGATTGSSSSSTGLPEAAKKTIKLQTLKKDDSNTSAAHAPTNGAFTLPKPGTPAGATAVQPFFVGSAEPDSNKSSRRIVKLKPPPGKNATGTTGTTAATAAPAFGASVPSTFSIGGQSTPIKPFGSVVGFTAQPLQMESVQEGSLLVVVLLRLAASSLQQRQHQLLLLLLLVLLLPQ